MLETKSLCTSYDGSTIFRFPNWKLAQGEQSLIIGKSGTGKTTLLHLLAGILKPTEGEILIAGTDIGKLKGATRDKFRGQNIGLIFQKPHLIDSLSVKENMMMAKYFAGLPQDLAALKSYLKELSIEHKLNSPVYALSQGEAQRVSIARAMLNEPKLILADEPTSSLDDENCKSVANLLLAQAKKHTATLVISTHDHRLKNMISNQLELKKEDLLSHSA
ncbi:ATP-binding cassette domain-containing protein [Flammeovirgaceae bacterium SG7u.111]|nr:ATP-binding cassette domain-containing protein [Flammeovirgaceae bacterium SG7u.132]WPO38511.1 ATP-binding cassette domain-containing protein [Flammeovirgaceae bacterium SG7u.111]